MKAKTIGGVTFKLRKQGKELWLEMKSGDSVIALPHRKLLQLHQLQELEEWVSRAQDEIEND